ncbi:MAG TPA: hypothetical protein PLS28_04650, partial [Clostridiales bacterium]|nr:hypothetical protein [Clostridiales bacterium]
QLSRSEQDSCRYVKRIGHKKSSFNCSHDLSKIAGFSEIIGLSKINGLSEITGLSEIIGLSRITGFSKITVSVNPLL